MNLDKHSTIVRLRSSIRSQEAASRDLRAQINALRLQGPSTGQERCNLHRRKQVLGGATREMLLALAFVRGRPYRTVEQSGGMQGMETTVAAAVIGIAYLIPGERAWSVVRHPRADEADALAPAVKAWLTADDAVDAPVAAQTEAAVAA
jgi:hypothetical protein